MKLDRIMYPETFDIRIFLYIVLFLKIQLKLIIAI